MTQIVKKTTRRVLVIGGAGLAMAGVSGAAGYLLEKLNKPYHFNLDLEIASGKFGLATSTAYSSDSGQEMNYTLLQNAIDNQNMNLLNILLLRDRMKNPESKEDKAVLAKAITYALWRTDLPQRENIIKAIVEASPAMRTVEFITTRAHKNGSEEVVKSLPKLVSDGYTRDYPTQETIIIKDPELGARLQSYIDTLSRKSPSKGK